MEKMKFLMLKCFLIFVVLLQNEVSYAQQLPLLNQNRENVNPAHVSSDYFKYNLTSTVNLRYRYQWTRLDDAPRTIMGNFGQYLEDYNFNFGGNIIKDQTGPTGFTGVYGRAGYMLDINDDLSLSFGMKAGVVQYNVKGDELNFLEAGDVANTNINTIYPDFSLGMMLYYKEHYYLGFSVPQIFDLNLEFKDAVNDYDLQRVRHYYGIVGGRFELSEDSYIELSSEARYVENVPFYINGRAEYEYKRLFYIAGGGSNANELNLGLGVIGNIGNGNALKVGYTFTNFFQVYGPNFGTVHELNASYSW